jgi:hypothetical protein
MSTLARIILATALVVPASAGATGPRPSFSLTASPAHIALHGAGQATVQVTNAGRRRVVVDVQRAGFALDLRGRPRIVRAGKHSAQSWIAARPGRFALGAGESTSLTIEARLPPRARPGDHAALLLLTTRRLRDAGVAVRMRLGVVVDVRAPGRLVHELVLRRLRVRRSGRLRTLELLVVNRGNVVEQLRRERVSLLLRRSGRPLATLRPEPRQLLPRTRGLVIFRYRGRGRGTVSARATVLPEGGGSKVTRTYRIRL